MHRITSLELLGTILAVLEKKANQEISSPLMLKGIFLSQRKLIDAILRVKLE